MLGHKTTRSGRFSHGHMAESMFALYTSTGGVRVQAGTKAGRAASGKGRAESDAERDEGDVGSRLTELAVLECGVMGCSRGMVAASGTANGASSRPADEGMAVAILVSTGSG